MAFPAVRRIERAAAWPLAGLCAWECAALVTGRIPTLSQLCRAHRRWLMPAAVVILALHIWYSPLPGSVPPLSRPGQAPPHQLRPLREFFPGHRDRHGIGRG